MRQRLEEYGGVGEQLVFAHANGYPPGSYRKFFAPMLDHYEVTGYKHRPLWSNRVPRRRFNWDYFADDLVNTLSALYTEPVWLMGHSMGAVISMTVATKAPQLVRGLVLIDPVFLPTRQALKTRMTSRKKLLEMPMVRKTLSRPNCFSNHQEAFNFHRAKRPFSAISDEVLWDYIHAGTKMTDAGHLELSFSPQWEAGVYASAPWVWPRVARLRLPTLGLRGETSQTLTAESFRRWAKLQPTAELHTCPGGHLLPLEHPESTARFVLDFLGRHSD
ncbi:MAG: alpha/beta fold hydrolase [Halioglobus sp.]